jgi:ATP-dependent RNA helicase DHX36
MTPGVLLRMLQVKRPLLSPSPHDSPLQTDSELTEWTHIIIDEAHERDRYTEFLFIILRNLIQNPSSLPRRTPKLILMSATMHIEQLSGYFGDIPHVHIGSSRFPVEEFYLEHILRFTDFRPRPSSSNGTKSLQPKEVQKRKTFRCPICNSSSKIFYSAVELGTHVALCNGLDNDPNPTLAQPVDDGIQQQECGRSDEVEEEEAEEEVAEEEVVDDDLDESDDPLIVADGESTFAQAASRLTLSHSDDELIAHYQRTWDDSLVDLDLIHSLLKYIFRSEFSKDHGVVLVFLPGWDDISRLKSLLLSDDHFRNPSQFRVLTLHSGISKQDQREIFQPVPHNVFKIVLSTNLAETSVTIDNVTVVIDAGKSKEKSYDPHVKLTSLKEGWISQSSANQRKGRAGRTRAGVCFRVYSSRRFQALPTHQESELTRICLEELVLTTKIMGLVETGPGHIHNFLAQAMDPPHPLSVSNAIHNLISLRCLQGPDETITTLGRALSHLPMDPFLSRALVFSALFGVLGSMIRLACAISYRYVICLSRSCSL